MAGRLAQGPTPQAGIRAVDHVLARDGSVKSLPGWQQNAWQQVGWVDGQTVVLGAANGASVHLWLVAVGRRERETR